MNVLSAWKLGYTGKKVVVTILDETISTAQDMQEKWLPWSSINIVGLGWLIMPVLGVRLLIKFRVMINDIISCRCENVGWDGE